MNTTRPRRAALARKNSSAAIIGTGSRTSYPCAAARGSVARIANVCVKRAGSVIEAAVVN